jgi:hypothetical protein
MCRQRAGIAFLVIFSTRPAGHGKGLRGPHVARGPRVEDPWVKGYFIISGVKESDQIKYFTGVSPNNFLCYPVFVT